MTFSLQISSIILIKAVPNVFLVTYITDDIGQRLTRILVHGKS